MICVILKCGSNMWADNCDDAEVIFQFLEANQIGQSHSIFYISYAMHLESKNKLRKADEILNLGLARLNFSTKLLSIELLILYHRKARSLVKLEDAYRTFLVRSTQKRHGDDVCHQNRVSHSWQLIVIFIMYIALALSSEAPGRQPAENFGQSKRMVALQRSAVPY
ncbi:hypothetical protein GW17_00011401 [Ensete ventricosum]|nr:hypothetical protein GW17_00011401 [Ensete ventricosum]RZR86167.1 hypothetical protein BHM03_00013313 [Ensete ventricosum]